MRVRTLALILVLSWCLHGCSGGETPVKMAAVTGEVKRMSGEPLGKVKVVFYPASGPTSVAVTDDGGKFTVQVPLGECRVAIVPNSDAPPDMSADAVAAAAEGDSKLNARYASAETSGLTVKVEEKQADKVVLVVE